MQTDFWDRIEAAAKAAKEKSGTVTVWKHRGYVPPLKHRKLVEAAHKISIPLSYEELNAMQ